ncbi:MAG: response regulator [Chloroflexi bacterium]|nr:response regulator [Chloroflexota bacterium]
MSPLDGKRILIVEDDLTNMAVYNAILRGTGAKVIQDFWNTNTVHLVERHLPIDIILLDLMLRYQMSGYDTFDKLKAIPALAHVPVVAVSAADPGIEIPKTKAKGFAGFIGKPIDPILFPDQIAACMAGEPVWYTPYGTLEDYER